MGKSQKPKPHHGRNAGDKISGDCLRIECRKPGTWVSFMMSGNHNGFRMQARKNATAIVEQAYTNIKK